MIGLGTIINTASIIGAGIVGHFAGNLFKEEQQESVGRVCGISVLFIAIAGAMEGMLKPDGGALTATNTMLVVICVVLGTVIGEVMRIESWFISFGTASLTVSIGAMAIVGSIEDGISQDYTTLALKSVLDFVIIVVMTSSLGKGCAFSAIPVFVFEGCMTLFAHLISPIMTAAAVANLSMIGSILIFCVGVNLVWDTKLRVANMLPAVILAVMAGLLPI